MIVRKVRGVSVRLARAGPHAMVPTAFGPFAHDAAHAGSDQAPLRRPFSQLMACRELELAQHG